MHYASSPFAISVGSRYGTPMKLLLLAAASLLLAGCNTIGQAVSVVARPVGGLLNAATAPLQAH